MEKYVKAGNIPNSFLTTECAATDAMLNEVVKYYDGKELVEQINKCL